MKKTICIITIIFTLCVACIFSILIYKNVTLQKRYQFCLQQTPALDDFAVEDSVAGWKNNENSLEYFYFSTGSYRIEYPDDKMVVVYSSGNDCFYQYVDGVLQQISMGYCDGNYHAYNTYVIEK